MSAFFSSEFIQHLANELNCDADDVQKAISNYIPGKSAPSKNTSSAKKEEDDTSSFIKKNAPSAKKSITSSKKCQRIPRGKTEICGKAAKNKIEENGEERWYCGTEKSGCYSSVISAQGKKEKEVRDKKPSVSAPPVPKKNASEIKSQSLIHKLVQTEKITTKGVMVDGKKLFMNPDSRVLFNRDKKAYGELAADDKTILPISDKNLRWLEATNTPVEQKRNEEEEEEEEDDQSISSGEEEDEEEEEDDDEEIVL